MKIRSLSGCAEKGVLASELADAADDALDETLQEITTTLSDALRGCPGQFSVAYLLLAQLIHYAHMQAPLDDPRLAAAMAALEAEDREIQQADFTAIRCRDLPADRSVTYCCSVRVVANCNCAMLWTRPEHDKILHEAFHEWHMSYWTNHEFAAHFRPGSGWRRLCARLLAFLLTHPRPVAQRRALPRHAMS